MNSLPILILSITCKKLLSLIFFIHGSFIATTRGELNQYWKQIAISNDANLNVSGQYLLNQRLSHNRVFGNRLMTVSAAMYLAKLENSGKFWSRFVNKIDKGHFEKAYNSHKEIITKEIENLK